jgi:hypothetical protein
MHYTSVVVFFLALLALVSAMPVPHDALVTPRGKVPNNPPKSSSALRALFPVPQTLEQWSTSSEVSDPLPLADSTFNPKAMLSALHPTYVDAPDGVKSMKAHYPAGSVALTHAPYGGLSFYAPGPNSVDLTTAKEVTLGYTVLFQEGFEFNLGGKLPGLYGGNSDSSAIGCSGGSRSDACFSARLMWRPNGAGEMYTYLPPSFSANQAVCHEVPNSDCNPTYGASVGRGSFHFTPGTRITLSERVRLNDVGKSNGQLEVFVNGQSIINVSGLVLRNSEEGRIRGIQMQTFFGGHEAQWASPKNQDAFFSDFSVAITEKL